MTVHAARSAASEAMVSWDDPALQVPGDPPRRARYRALQSWYRETQLGVEPGEDGSGRLVGSLLPQDRAREGLNFLEPAIWRYAEQRAETVLADGGTLEVDRLRRNLLSSMPLCFNLFAKLHAEPAAAARVLGVVLGLDIATVEEVLVEHAPPAAKQLLGDRTAFDAFVRYRTGSGASGFLGIETKYTEPFSPTTLQPGRYEPSRAFTAAGFASGAAARLAGPATSQLLRNTLLAAATRHADGSTIGHAVVLTGRDDATARRAVALVRAELAEPDGLLRWLSLERLMEQCRLEPRLRDWAGRFRRRYLDLSPIADRFPVPARPRIADPELARPAQPTFEEQVRQLATHCSMILGDLRLLTEPPGYPDSLALCVLDAVWSMGVRYPAVQAVVGRYRQHRRRLGADPGQDRLQDLLATVEEAGGPDGFAQLVGNRQRTAPRGGTLKAAAVASAARALADHGIDSTHDLHQAIRAGRAEQLEPAWRAVPGQRSGISWRYLLMLAGIPQVKPDRMIRRFVAHALQLGQVGPEAAADLLTAVAHTTPGVSVRALDHAIWSYQRKLVRPEYTS